MHYFVVLDIGTSSVRAVIFNEKLTVIAQEQKEISLQSPQSGWVEQDPQELWLSTLGVLKKIIEKIKIDEKLILGLGITNQRETTIIWSKRTGQSIYPAIVWQDRRTADFCNFLKKKKLEKNIYQKTGLRLDPYFSATKVNWLLNNVAGARKSAEEGELIFGTVDSWIIWNLTKGQSHVTDISNASRTMLFNIKNLSWDKELLKIFLIPENILPRVLPSASESENFGLTRVLYQEIPIVAVCGDQSAALFGEQCFDQGEAKATYGTGGFVLVNVGNKPKLRSSKLITTVAWQIDKKVTYALEGSIFQSGGSLKWLRDNLKLFDDYEKAMQLAASVKDSGNVFVVPAWVGLGSPHWQPEARGVIVGLSSQTKLGHIIKAAIESAAFQVVDILDVIKKDYNLHIKKIKVDGGLTKADYLLQFQSDVAGVIVEKPTNQEMTSFGVALMLAIRFKFKIEFKASSSIYSPKLSKKIKICKLQGWREALLKT